MYSKITTNLIFVIVFVMVGLTGTAGAQQNEINNSVNIGIQLSQYQQDFGAGMTLTSPWFGQQRIAVRARSHVMFHEHMQEQETTWNPYLNATIGVTGKTGRIGDSILLYGEGGVIGLFPSDDFSSESFEFGGYGLFGFEFYMNPDSNYFIEIGAVGTGAKADEVANEPIYSNGLTISTGFRLNL